MLLFVPEGFQRYESMLKISYKRLQVNCFTDPPLNIHLPRQIKAKPNMPAFTSTSSKLSAHKALKLHLTMCAVQHHSVPSSHPDNHSSLGENCTNKNTYFHSSTSRLPTFYMPTLGINTASSGPVVHSPISTTARTVGAVAFAMGFAIALKTVVGIANTKAPAPKTTSHPLPYSLRVVILLYRKVWPSHAAVVHGVHGSFRRREKMICWYEQGKYAQDISIRGVLDHSVAVEKFLNERFYEFVPSSMGAPCRLSFDVKMTLVKKVKEPSMTISELRAVVIENFRHFKACKPQLCITAQEEKTMSYRPCTVPPQVLRKLLRAGLSTSVINHSLLLELAGILVIDIIERKVVDVEMTCHDFIVAGINPPGWGNFGDQVVPLEPWEEAHYVPLNLRKNMGFRRLQGAPEMTSDMRDRFDSNLPNFNPQDIKYRPTNLNGEEVPGSYVMSPKHHHAILRVVAAHLKKKAEDVKVPTRFKNIDIPEGPDYLCNGDFQSAYQHELQERVKASNMTPEQIDEWLINGSSKGKQDAVNFASNRQMSRKFWDANPEQYEYHFGGRPWSRSSGEASSQSGETVSSHGSSVAVTQSPDSQGNSEYDITIDPAVISAVVKRPSRTTKPTGCRLPPSFKLDEAQNLQNLNTLQQIPIQKRMAGPAQGSKVNTTQCARDLEALQQMKRTAHKLVQKLVAVKQRQPGNAPRAPPGFVYNAYQNAKNMRALHQLEHSMTPLHNGDYPRVGSRFASQQNWQSEARFNVGQFNEVQGSQPYSTSYSAWNRPGQNLQPVDKPRTWKRHRVSRYNEAFMQR
ncbi:hypothetical protein GQ44DRAFT_729508 [Phaeosphaeriaceae sp. PMI808]|nr:hypothetical protein GQ44DRAFT_729508 [Phaeosphaeriaceae sp. PMI808]